MGYRSEVVFAIGPPLVDKFLAVMAASEKVRDLVKYNEVYKQGIRFGFYNEGDIVVNLDSIKWYESYEDVQGLEHMLELVEKFGEERDFNYAGCKLRIGENTDDAEAYDICSDDGTHLQHALWDMCGIERRIINNF